MATSIAHLPPRDQIAAAIETMVAVLDDLDGDADLEPDDEYACLAADDQGTAEGGSDGLPGDEADREEDDHSGDALDNGELGSCHGLCC